MSAAEALSTKNSQLREVFRNPLEFGVNLIDEKAPWITPDMITMTGTAGVLATDYIFTKFPKKSLPLAAVHGILSITDALDGGLARKRAQDHGTETTAFGAILDALSDKSQEFAVGVVLAHKARSQGENAGAAVHVLAGMTSVLPALFRARAEANGNVVAEGGLGTRPIRVISGIVAMAASDKPRVSQAISGATLLTNTTTAIKRSQAIDPESRYAIGSMEDPADLAASRKKYAALKLAATATTAIGLGLLARRKN